MSDPVTDVEIEDVLSSIRRLVGDEHRMKPSVKPQVLPEVDPVELPVKPTRLVLTPSLLVPVSDAEPENESAPTADMEMQSGDATSVLETGTTEAEFEDEFEAEVEPDSELITEAEMDFVFESSQTHGRNEKQDAPQQAAWADPEATLFNAPSVDGLINADDGMANPQGVESLEPTAPFDLAPEAALGEGSVEQAVRDQPVEDYFAVDSFDVQTDQLNQTVQSQQSDPEDPFAVDPDVAETVELDSEADGEPKDDTPYSTATLGAKIAALEAKIGQTQDQWEPDGELGDDYAGTQVETIEWQDEDAADAANLDATTSQPDEPKPTSNISDVEADQMASATEVEDEIEAEAKEIPKPLISDRQDDDPVDLMASDDAILDEESLRELVADIVRQELQGALGERITRNVRKLVRREIHRALTAQELD